MRKASRLGIRLLAEQAEFDLEAASEETIGFMIAPRLNALGRLGDANVAIELLLCDDPVRGRILAAQIERLNAQRKLLTDQVYQAAEERIAADMSLLGPPVLLLEHASWPAGVLGIVASRLVERYRKPTILLSHGENHIWRGSARSIDGLHIDRAIAASREVLVNFGGHPMAAGPALSSEQLPGFRAAVQRSVSRMLAEGGVADQELRIDTWASLADHSLALADNLERMAPFGAGNPAPVLATRGLRIRSTGQLGVTQEHRKLIVVDDSQASAEVIWWNSGRADIPAASIDIAYSMRPTIYRGKRTLSLTLIDLRVSRGQSIEVASEPVNVIDLRATEVPELPSDCLVWEEGVSSPRGVNRFLLRPSPKLAIWTSPPGRAELESAMRTVQPRVIYLIGKTPDVPNTAEELLRRLAGMTKCALSRRGGRATISELAAASAQRVLAVRIGLEWLAAGGHIALTSDGDEVRLQLGSGQAETSLQVELMAGLRSLLEETAAFRAYFLAAASRSLIQ